MEIIYLYTWDSFYISISPHMADQTIPNQTTDPNAWINNSQSAITNPINPSQNNTLWDIFSESEYNEVATTEVMWTIETTPQSNPVIPPTAVPPQIVETIPQAAIPIVTTPAETNTETNDAQLETPTTLPLTPSTTLPSPISPQWDKQNTIPDQNNVQTPVMVATPVTVNTPIASSNTTPATQAPIVVPNSTPSTPSTPQTPPIAPTTPIVVKKWSKISLKWFLIGCVLFGFVIIGAISVILYIALQNPNQFQGIIGIDGIKTGLKLFTGLFFGLLFLGWFAGSIFNIYKLTTAKVGKIKYILWALFSILFVGWAVFGGMVSFNTINEIIETTGANSTLLNPTIQFRDKARSIWEGFPIIAPTKITYGVNTTILQRIITNSFANKRINTISLDCGNQKQILSYNPNRAQFEGQCLYMNKWDYPITLIINTTEPSTSITTEETLNMGDLNVTSEIRINPSLWSLTFNDANDEIIIGRAPVKVEFDSEQIFSDYKLSDYKIEWDLDNDGVFDREDIAKFNRQFRTPQVQPVYYRIPNLGNFGHLVYMFDMRVLQNEVPICTITPTRDPNNPLQYVITTTFDDDQTQIVTYLYQTKNLSTGRTTPLPGNRRTNRDYTFPNEWNYVILLEYITDNNKKWNCESDTIEVWSADFTINYTMQYKWPNDVQRSSINSEDKSTKKETDEPAIVSLSNDRIIARILPITLQLSINSIFPQSNNLNTQVLLDDVPILSPDNKTYEIILQQSDHKAITIITQDTITQDSTTLTIPLTILQQDIVWILEAFPDTIGTSPFEVTLDASTTRIIDQDDEIIYFSWKFGDGKETRNSSQARVSHTYVYDDNTQNGTYIPSVTITTRKWKNQTFELANPILVKKAPISAAIAINSHPGQIALAGEQVQFSLNTDGNTREIVWDFGIGETIQCDNRTCMNVPMLFYEPGTYTITATITFADMTTSTATTKLTVRE